MEKQQWLDSLKDGDVVAESVLYVSGAYNLCKVLRRTKTQIVIQSGKNCKGEPTEKKYRNDGVSVGGDVWHHSYITEPTEAIIHSIRLRRAKDRVNDLRVRLSAPNDLAVCERMIDALTPFVENK